MIDIAEFAENLRNLAKNFLRNKGPSTKGGPDIAECANIAEILGKKLSAILPPCTYRNFCMVIGKNNIGVKLQMFKNVT